MKSRISYFSGTVFRKNLTRFAPAWAIYLICGLLALRGILIDSYDASFSASMMPLCFGVTAAVNLGYGLLVAELLFGDIFSARLCNALHAMPMRREGWFITHVLSGLCFGVIPNGVLALSLIPQMETYWRWAFFWMAAADMQFLFFFAAGVLCMFLSGNRFAAAINYGLLNFLSQLIRWLLETLYLPVMPGVSIHADPYMKFCPIVQLIGKESMNWNAEMLTDSAFRPQNWTYLLILSGLALIMFISALLLYRRRKLESAGDFLAVKVLHPVFLILFTLTVSGIFQFFGSIFADWSKNIGFLISGLIIGFFTGQMLLQRQIRVFQWKSLAGFAIFTLVFFGSIFAAKQDVFGIVSWTPKTASGVDIGFNERVKMHISDPEAIEKIIQSHQEILNDSNGENFDFSVYYNYQMENGRKISRCYHGISADSKSGRLLKPYFSDPKMVFQCQNWEEFRKSIITVNINLPFENEGRQAPDVDELLDALEKDCKAGTMVQENGYHPRADHAMWLDIEYRDENGNYAFCGVSVWNDAAHTAAYLKEHHIDSEAMSQEVSKT